MALLYTHHITSHHITIHPVVKISDRCYNLGGSQIRKIQAPLVGIRGLTIAFRSTRIAHPGREKILKNLFIPLSCVFLKGCRICQGDGGNFCHCRALVEDDLADPGGDLAM